MLEVPKGVAEWELTVELQEEPTFCLQINEAETSSNDQAWYTDIKEYLEHQKPSDNGTLFVNKRMGGFLDKFKIQRHRSSPYRPQMNGEVEAANKTIVRILEKMVKTL
ncbi:uncharacterized protein LOC131228774 [Magnolia sinica]|uniref:uncharacterized protein LOC131228774 n=1 Tax=Magnolia sinica TaxID=86752 RepID=UPI00265ABD89|nr:uncharacterized protein LOC131228774 [Magnolia sinica]